MKKHYSIKIYWRVQWILFRKLVKQYCDKHKIWWQIENHKQWHCEAILYCDLKNITNFKLWLRSNPSLSIIHTIILKEINQNTKTYIQFKIYKTSNFILDKLIAFKNLLNYFLKRNINLNHIRQIPNHLIIIPDWNRRRARKRWLEWLEWHKIAINNNRIEDLYHAATQLWVKHVSLWGFSTENWKRSKKEVDSLMHIFNQIADELKITCKKNNIWFHHIWRKTKLPKELIKKFDKLEKDTIKFTKTSINLFIDYGWREEIISTINSILKEKINQISEKDFSKHLYTKLLPDPDIIIRTSNEKRLSGMVPFQWIYSELFFIKKDFPAFKSKDLKKIIYKFGKRKRRFWWN